MYTKNVTSGRNGDSELQASAGGCQCLQYAQYMRHHLLSPLPPPTSYINVLQPHGFAPTKVMTRNTKMAPQSRIP
jgi:hypothetical protein